MHSTKTYVGIHNDHGGGLTDAGKVIRDAWVFGIIPESETCEGWPEEGVQGLRHKINREWRRYGFLASNLPQELRDRFMRIHNEAVARARRDGGQNGDGPTRGS